MDEAKRQARQQAINECGRCHQPEDAHLHRGEADEIQRRIWAALGGPCEQYVASDASVVYAKHLAIVNNRAPQRKPGGPIPKRTRMCPCGNRHAPGACPFTGAAPGPETYSNGAARARDLLARKLNPPEAS